MNYVSCSPFRVPIARLAAARAAVNEMKARPAVKKTTVVRKKVKPAVKKVKAKKAVTRKKK